MARRSMALVDTDATPVSLAIADAKSRLETAQAEHAGLVDQIRVFQESIAKVNAEGVELEKRIIGIQGEITALTALQGKA